MEKLKPCPFCGSIKGLEITHVAHETFEIECQNIHCMFQPNGVFETKEEAIELWNIKI